MEIGTLGIERAKSGFQPHGVDKEGTLMARSKFRRRAMLPREAEQVQPAQVKQQKNEGEMLMRRGRVCASNDAQAICEAVTGSKMLCFTAIERPRGGRPGPR